MFKGLRTKIESEQKGQIPKKSTSSFQASKAIINSPTSSENKQTDVTPFSKEEHALNPTFSGTIDESVTLSAPEKSVDPLQTEAPNPNEQIVDLRERELSKKLIELDNEISLLRNQLNVVSKERDENNDQNGQLYQIVEKLRRNLESEKETNSSLSNRLNEVESALKERNTLIESLNVSPKSVSWKLYASKESAPDEPQTLDDLRLKINQLQDQLLEKNRQVRICNQNMNDIKKALQKEINDHSKTQDELNQIQDELSKLQAQLKQHMYSKGESTTNEDPNPQNGSEEVGYDSPQMDRMSNLSRSSASVDEFDSNDLPSNSDKDVNHEYLRNVIFRYMTSTDTLTAKHLVKAISVMMNFTPEQSAAVKSAIHARKSWLRLS